MRTVLAGDLGGTKCRLALVAADLTVHAAVHVDTVRQQQLFLTALDQAVAQVLAARPAELEPPTAIGIGLAGMVRPDGEIIEEAPNIPLIGYPLRRHLRERFELSVALINDGRASAWGEHLRGAAQGLDPLLCLFFGTGVGIGLMVDGRPYSGFGNAAGEIGHTIFRPGGRRCPCGLDGHFEAYCGGRAITDRATEQIGAAPGGRWTVGDVVALSAHDDARGAAACEILDDAAEAACVLVANACTLLNPAAVVLGGGVLTGWPLLRQRIEDYVQVQTRGPVRAGLRFEASLGGSDAILWGAAAATGALTG